MDIAQILAFAFVVIVLVVTVRRERPEIALLISMIAGVLIVIKVLAPLGEAVGALADLAVKANVERYYLDTVLRIVGVAYLAEFGAQVCRDAGESALAGKVELAGKVLIAVLAVPVIGAVVQVILRMLP
jgi:stage III sporulation protein AD